VDGRLIAELPAPDTKLNSGEDIGGQNILESRAEGDGEYGMEQLNERG
jgi:hypothetical protein